MSKKNIELKNTALKNNALKNNALVRLTAIHNQISNQPQPTGPIDLTRERENATFDVKHMNWFFWGDKESAEALVSYYFNEICIFGYRI